MTERDLSRRTFGRLAGAGLAAGPLVRGQAGLTARQVIERIQKNVGVEWRAKTVDTFKAGNPDTQVKGIATTVMSTYDVLERAAAAGKNLVITHEPTFYNHEDQTEAIANDPVYKAKHELIAKHDLVVWRFHDHWHARKPDGMITGMAKDLGWTKFQGENEPRYTLPETTLGALATDVAAKLHGGAIRVVGRKDAKVSRVGLAVGYNDLRGAMRGLQAFDVLVIGESREWEGVEYAADLAATGAPKGLIILGHALSEDPGMKECAAWLRTFVTEVPIEFIPAGEPYWRP